MNSTPILPVVIRGGGAIAFNGNVYYWKGDATISVARKTFNVDSDLWGNLDVRSQGGPMVDIEVPLIGDLTNFARYFPYGPTSLVAASSVGNSIFGAAPVPLTIALKSATNVVTYARAAIYKSPTLQLSPRKTGLGTMTFRCLNRIDLQPTNANVLLSAANTAFTDTSFNSPNVITDMYTASLGVRPAPFNAIGARNGFELEPVYEMTDCDDDYVGVADTFLTSIGFKCRFAPNNLTEPQVQALLNWQGANAILAGQSVAQGNGGGVEALTIAAGSHTAILYAAGAWSAKHGCGVKVDRNGVIEFAQQQTVTGSAPGPLFSII